MYRLIAHFIMATLKLIMDQEFNNKNSAKISLNDALQDKSVKVRNNDFNRFEEGDILVLPSSREDLESRLVKQIIGNNSTIFIKVDTFKADTKTWTACNFYPSQVNKSCFLAAPVPGETDDKGNQAYTRGERKATCGTFIDKIHNEATNVLQWILDHPGIKVKVTPTKYKSYDPVFVQVMEADGTVRNKIERYVVGETTINQYDIVTDELPAKPAE